MKIRKTKVFHVVKKERLFRVRKIHVKQSFWKRKFYHPPLCDLSDLHDEEEYSFYSTGPAGYYLRRVMGYRLKTCWDMYEKAFQQMLSPRLRRRISVGFKSNWIDVVLPNGMMLTVQPRSATRSYYVER